jgi:hypothetical protein
MLRGSVLSSRNVLITHISIKPVVSYQKSLFHSRRCIARQNESQSINFSDQSLLTIDTADEKKEDFIKPDFYKKSRGELVKLHYEAFKPILLRITQEDGYTPFDTYNFIIGKPELREKVFRAAFFRFGSEIPSTEKNKIVTVKDLVNWYAMQIVAQREPKIFDVPKPIAQLIAQNREKRRLEKEEQENQRYKQWLEDAPKRKFKQHFGDAFTEEEVRAALKILDAQERNNHQSKNKA